MKSWDKVEHSQTIVFFKNPSYYSTYVCIFSSIKYSNLLCLHLLADYLHDFDDLLIPRIPLTIKTHFRFQEKYQKSGERSVLLTISGTVLYLWWVLKDPFKSFNQFDNTKSIETKRILRFLINITFVQVYDYLMIFLCSFNAMFDHFTI